MNQKRSYPLEYGHLQKYMDEISRFELLDKPKERELIEKAQKGDQKARDRLVVSNLKFVVKVAFNFVGQGLPVPDLVSEGNLGLIKAIEKFDTSQNVKFISFAVWWIRQAMVQAIIDKAKLIRTTAHHERILRKINSKNFRLKQTIGGELIPDENESRAVAGVSVKDYRNAMDANHRIVSGDATLKDSAGADQFSLIQDTQALSPYASVESADRLKVLEDTLEELEPRESKILRMYYGLSGMPCMTLEDIAALLPITKERVRQIKKKALEKLKNLAINKQYLLAA